MNNRTYFRGLLTRISPSGLFSFPVKCIQLQYLTGKINLSSGSSLWALLVSATMGKAINKINIAWYANISISHFYQYIVSRLMMLYTNVYLLQSEEQERKRELLIK